MPELTPWLKELAWKNPAYSGFFKSVDKILVKGEALSPKQAKVISWQCELCEIENFPYAQVPVRDVTVEDLLGEDVRTLRHWLKFYPKETLREITSKVGVGTKPGKKAPVFVKLSSK